MEVLRTEDSRFANLARYPFAPSYAIVDGDHHLRMHYVEVGKKDAPAVLMLHGEPTWSYLYRHMIQMIAEAGYRVVAPDLIGFGRSDKPADTGDYSYASHVGWVHEFIEVLSLEDIVLVCHDWGGLIGLRLVASHPQLFSRVVASNTFLPTGDGKMPDAFFRWRDLSQNVADLDVGMVIQGGCLTRLPENVLAAYRAPFPDASYMAGVRSFPMLVPITPDAPGAAENRLAWQSLSAFDRPVLVAFSDGDPITRGLDATLHERIVGAQKVEPVVIAGGSHFLQEDRGSELAQAILHFLVEFPPPTRKKVAPPPAAATAVPTEPTQPLPREFTEVQELQEPSEAIDPDAAIGPDEANDPDDAIEEAPAVEDD